MNGDIRDICIRTSPAVYLATKIKHAAKFRELREEWGTEGVRIISRWLDQAIHEDVATPEEFSIFWRVDVEDVEISDALVIYGEAGDELRGALVEAGVAIAKGLLVIVVGDSPSFGSWQFHPTVVRAQDLAHAKELIQQRFRDHWRAER
jgi:hypothetical protein